MAHIIMNTGDVVLIDDEDYAIVSKYSWRKSNFKGYAMTTFKMNNDTEHTVYLHKLIMGQGCFGKCDHKDGDVLDCRKQNLRVATSQQNSANVPKFKGRKGKPCSSQYKGVFKLPNGKYRATIGFNKKSIQLGTYVSEDDAGLAYNVKARELFGEFALLNEIKHSA